MKKILLSLFVLFLGIVSYGQYPVSQSLGSDSTLVTSKGGLKGRIVNWVFTDTIQANTQRIKDYPGAQIVTSSDTSLWFRSNNMWLKVRSSGSSVPTNDTLAWRVGGNDLATLQKSVNLGTLSADPIKFITNSTIRMVLDENGIIRSSGAANKCVTIDTITKTLYYYDCAAGGGGLQTASNGLTASGSNVKLGGTLVNNTNVNGSAIYDLGFTDIDSFYSNAFNYSFNIEPSGQGRLMFDLDDQLIWSGSGITLPNVPPTDTTLNVVGITSSGLLVKTLKSSIAAAPTLQQVLTAGSTLNTDNTISAVGTANLSFTGFQEFNVTSADDQIFTVNNSGNPNIITIGVGDVKINPSLGNLKIDTLNYTLSTAGKKIMLRDTATGLVQNIDPALIGGSGAASPTPQINMLPADTIPPQVITGTFDAFGTMGQFPSGKMAMVYRSAGIHGFDDSAVIMMRISEDNGMTWDSVKTVLDEDGVDLRNIGGGVTPSGRYVIFYARYLGGTTFGGQFVIYSDDEGATWSSPYSVSNNGHSEYSPYGGIVSIADNLLLLSWYGWTGTTYATYVIRSSDDGATWGSPIAVSTGTTYETTEASYAYLGGGYILCLSRVEDSTAFAQFRSLDNGLTWTYQGHIEFDNWSQSNPATPWLTAFIGVDGRRQVGCWYGERFERQLRVIYGAAADLMVDGIYGWQTNTRADLDTFAVSADAGYPSVIHPNDGTYSIGWYYEGSGGPKLLTYPAKSDIWQAPDYRVGARITPRVYSLETPASVTINSDSTDMYTSTYQSQALTINAPTGTPRNGQALTVRIQSSPSAHALTWNSIFNSTPAFTLPGVTVSNQEFYAKFNYNTNSVKWDLTGLTYSGGSAVTSVTGTTNRITSTGGTTPVLDISSSYVGQTSITTLGTIGTGMIGTGAVIARPTMTLGSDATGDIYYRNASGILTRLPIGTAGQTLHVVGGIPTWVDTSASGGGGWGTTGTVATLTGASTLAMGTNTFNFSNGKIGVNTTPTGVLHLKETGNSYTDGLILEASGTDDQIGFISTAGGLYIGHKESGGSFVDLGLFKKTGSVLYANSGNTLKVEGVSNQYAAKIFGFNNSGTSYGLHIQAGNTSTDEPLYITNIGGTELLVMKGNGNLHLGTGAGSEKLTVTGNLKLSTAGNKIFVATGSNASIGQSAAMTAGTITISTTAVTSSSIIMLVHATVAGTQGILSVGTITAGTSFVINSSSATDTGTVNWWIIN